jgi:hypothetical protein
MELYGLNAARAAPKLLQCINIQWNRRYYEAGDFALQLRAQDWDSSIAYIYTAERPELGMVQKIETEHTEKGDFVNVSGFFLEGMFNWKVVWYRAAVDGNVADACRSLMTTYMTYLGNITLTVPAGDPVGEEDTFEFEGQMLGDSTYGALKLQELGQRILWDPATDAFTYEVWQGLDRTQSQNTNTYAVFSQDNGTVDSLVLTADSSNYYNCAHVVYGDDMHTEVYNWTVGTPRRWLYIMSDINEADYTTNAKFLAAVQHAALMELQEYQSVVNIDATVLQRNLHYLIDYDLGDKCDARDDKTGLAYETRIIEINEVWKENTHTVTLQFGDKIPVKG